MEPARAAGLGAREVLMADAPVTIDAVYRVAGILNRERVPFAFIGGVALGAWAIPRGTFDMDLTVSLQRTRLQALLGAFETDGFVVDPMPIRL